MKRAAFSPILTSRERSSFMGLGYVQVKILCGITFHTPKALILENHAHLVELGVSHPALEAIKAKTLSYNLQTKLTGAGGGGCAVTLIPDSTYSPRILYSVLLH